MGQNLSAGQRSLAVLVALFMVSAPFLTVNPASAQAPAPPGEQNTAGQSALSVSPAIVDNSLDPGVTFNIDISIANQTSDPVAVRSSTRELTADQPVDEDKRSVYDASSWFTVNNPDFILLAQERKAVSVKVAVPKEAEPGGHYATINFDSFVPGQKVEGATAVNARVGVIVLLTVSGDVRERVSMVGKVKTKFVQTEALPTTFQMTLSNDGNVHVLPQGKFVVRDVFGRKIKEIDIPLGTLLPGTDRTYEATWEHGPYVGVYNVEADIVGGTQRTQFGPGTFRFILLPLVIVVPVAVLLLIGLVVTAFQVRKRRKKRASPAGQPVSVEPPEEASKVPD